MSDNETISKSRVFYEGWLPGSVKRLHNESFAMVLGVSDNPEESRQVDREQLIGIARAMVSQWKDAAYAEVDSRLEAAMESPEDQLAIVSPGTLYVTPYPLMLRCTQCQVLNYQLLNHQDINKRRDALKEMEHQSSTHGSRPVIPCRRKGCNGVMQQVPFVAVHRCGHISAIHVPYRSRRTQNLGFNERSGAFLQSFFFDVDTGLQTEHALQDKCPSCKNSYDKASKKGRPATNPDCFHAHNIQYLCLKEETGKLVSRVNNLVSAEGNSGLGLDIAEAVVSTLLGLCGPEALEEHLKDCLEGNSKEEESTEELITQRESKRKSESIVKAQAELLGEETVRDILKSLQREIKELTEKIDRANGRFSKVRNLFASPATIGHIGAHRRAIEAALLPYDFAKERESLKEYIAQECNPLRRDALLQDFRVLKQRYGIAEIAHYKQINVVMASLGYTRELANASDDSDDGNPPLTLMGYQDLSIEHMRGKTVVYALPARTEALQIYLDPCRILRWCVEQMDWENPGDEIMGDKVAAHAHLLSVCPALSMSPAEVLSACKHLPDRVMAPFHLLHTISHCLLGTIKRHTGYDEKGIMEYLIPMDLSIMLYVTSVQNYTAGGLLILFRHHLRQWLDDASNYAFNCIFDPLCSDKGASCSGCVQIVIGCETFNHGLSRSYLHGGKLTEDSGTGIELGFWQ